MSLLGKNKKKGADVPAAEVPVVTRGLKRERFRHKDGRLFLVITDLATGVVRYLLQKAHVGRGKVMATTWVAIAEDTFKAVKADLSNETK